MFWVPVERPAAFWLGDRALGSISEPMQFKPGITKSTSENAIRRAASIESCPFACPSQLGQRSCQSSALPGHCTRRTLTQQVYVVGKVHSQAENTRHVRGAAKSHSGLTTSDAKSIYGKHLGLCLVHAQTSVVLSRLSWAAVVLEMRPTSFT